MNIVDAGGMSRIQLLVAELYLAKVDLGDVAVAALCLVVWLKMKLNISAA